MRPDVADEYRRLVREMQRLALEIQLQQPDAEPVDVEVDLSRITVPVTIYTGGRDFPTYRAIGERLARRPYRTPKTTHPPRLGAVTSPR